ncbi:MAG: AAA family ATPase [Verrucomicrobia bacterium]|nr:AAA family ATPase [Verrucomicrobiota bacterium]
MRTVWLMCGLSFSGKTTLAHKIVDRLQCGYISLDDINAEPRLWGGDGILVEEWERTHALARERLAKWMDTGKDAVVDDVNNLRWLRDRWRSAASAGPYHTIVIYLDIPREELVARRCANQLTAERKGITEAVWAKHFSEFQPPEADEQVIRYKLTEDAASWVISHFEHGDGRSAQ